MADAQEKVTTPKGTQMPIEMKRGPQPAGWSVADQIALDTEVRKDEWHQRERKLGTNRPFPGLSRTQIAA